MTTIVPSAVTASLRRALLGEVPRHLRCVQFRGTDHHIALRFVFDRQPDDTGLDFISVVGGEVAADFSGVTVSEDAVVAGDGGLPVDGDWHTMSVGETATLAR